MVTLIGIVLSAVTGWFSPEKNLKLQYTFLLGEEYELAQNTTQTIQQSIMGMDQLGENTFVGKMSFKVVATTETGATLEVQYLFLKNRSKTIMGDLSMDSQGPPENAHNRVFKAMMGKPFFVTVSSMGKVEEVKGAANLWSGVAVLGLDVETELSLKKSLHAMLSPEALKNNFEQVMVNYADVPVSVGDTWQSNGRCPMDFPIRVDNTWTLKNLSGTKATVNAEGAYTTTDREKIIGLPNGLNARVDFLGKQQIKSSIDIRYGWPTDLQITSELKGQMILVAGGFLPQDVEIPTEIHTETTYKVVRK